MVNTKYVHNYNVILNKTVVKLVTILTKCFFFPYLSPTSYLNSWYNAPFTYYDATWRNMMQYTIRGKIHNLIFQIRDATGHSSWEKFMISKLCIFRFIHLNYFHSRLILCYWQYNLGQIESTNWFAVNIG